MLRKFILLLVLFASSFLVYSQMVSSKKYFKGENDAKEFLEESRKVSKYKNNKYGYIFVEPFDEDYYKTLDDGTGSDGYFLAYWTVAIGDFLIYVFRLDTKNGNSYIRVFSNARDLADNDVSDILFPRAFFKKRYYLGEYGNEYNDLIEDWNTLINF